jgi:hypothetical protein
MRFHRKAKPRLAGRYTLVMSVEQGCSTREAASRHGASPATACLVAAPAGGERRGGATNDVLSI